MPTAARMTPSEWATLALLSLLWGGSFFFAEIAVRDLPPLAVVLARVALAAPAPGLALAWRGVPLPRGAALWRAFAAMGLLNDLVPFTLLFWGQTVIPSALASVLNATTPLFSLLAARALIPGEGLAPGKVAGVLLGVGGVAVLVGAEAAAGSRSALLPALACLGAAPSYGCAGVFGRRFGHLGVDPAAAAFGQTAATSALALPLVLAFAPPWRADPPGAPVWGPFWPSACSRRRWPTCCSSACWRRRGRSTRRWSRCSSR